MKYRFNYGSLLGFAIAFLAATAYSTPPAAPTNVRAIILPAEILFTWDESPGADYYKVYRGGPTRRWVPLSPVTEPRFRDTDFVPLPGYYQISAYNNAGEVSATAPFMVSNVTSSISLIGVTPRPVSDTSFAVAWTVDGPMPFRGYGYGFPWDGGDGMLEVGPDLDHMKLVGFKSVASSRHEFIVENLEPNTTYTYRLTSVGPNKAGFTYWNTFTTRPYVAPPPAVISLTSANPTLIADEDKPVEFVLTANNRDGTPLSAFVTGTLDGIVWGSPPNLTFLPNPERQSATIIYCGYTDGVFTNYVSVIVTVRPFQDPPIALDKSFSFVEDNAGSFFLQAAGWDFDPNLVDCEIVSGPTNGTLRGWTTPKLQRAYIPNTNSSGIDHFTYRCFYNNSTGNIATVRLFVMPVNDAPVTLPQSVTVPSQTAQRITLNAYEPDALGDIWGSQMMSYGIVSVPNRGSVSYFEPSAGLLPLSVVYTPAAGYAGTDSFSYFLADGQYSSTGLVSVLVLPPPQPAAPGNLTATAARRNLIDLTWADNSDNEDGFRIERTPSGTNVWVEIGRVGSNVGSFTATGQKANKVYDFRVRAFNPAGNSAYSNTASTKARK